MEIYKRKAKKEDKWIMTIKQEKPDCKLKVCAKCNQIRGYNQCKEDVKMEIKNIISVADKDADLWIIEELEKRING